MFIRRYFKEGGGWCKRQEQSNKIIGSQKEYLNCILQPRVGCFNDKTNTTLFVIYFIERRLGIEAKNAASVNFILKPLTHKR